MKLIPLVRSVACAAVLVAITACQSTSGFDYGCYLDHMPRSILVLPPLDESPETDATAEYLATVTEPLAECGYYVFPVAMVDQMMRDNGLPTPYEMHDVSLSKLGEVFGADAVLYVTIKEWGTSSQVLESRTTVRVVGRLVDVTTGEELWHGERTATESSNDHNQAGIVGALVGALMTQVASDVADPSPALSKEANESLFHDSHHGLLSGHYHPNHAKDQEARKAALTAPAK